MSTPTDALAPQEAERQDLPLVFISHKSKDATLAKVVRDFIRNLSGRRVEVFNSSSARDKGPGFGTPLPDELKRYLAKTSLVILLYTDPTEQWEWCLWECGVATDPLDDTRTRVEVFSFSGDIPEPYKSQQHVLVLPASHRDYQQGRVGLQRFAGEFCRTDNFLPDRKAISLSITNEELDKCVDDFLNQVPPLPVDLARRRLHAIADGLQPETADLLVEAVERAADALEWGLEDAAHHQLFEDCWNQQYVDDLEKLRNRTIVFRPPSVERFWARLLDLAIERERVFEGPWIRLVSGEGSSAVSFWYQAMEDRSADARAYENSVREVARKLSEKYDEKVVERRFLFEEDYFIDDPQNLQSFVEIVDWMNNAQIAVSVGLKRDARDTRWLDFALIGDFAVSRFASVGGVANRVLEENFLADEVRAARSKWDRDLKPYWTSSDGTPFEEYLKKHHHVIG